MTERERAGADFPAGMKQRRMEMRMDEHQTGDCYTRDCVLKQGISCCGACEQFPCDTIMTKPHTTVLDKDWLRWKKDSNTNR